MQSSYEETIITQGLTEKNLLIDDNPEGKIIERIEIVTLPIITPTDPWPNFLNYFHVRTKEHVVYQELLIEAGEPWNQKRIEESERNLRKLFILGVVRTVACKGSAPGKVVWLIVSKDLWSIRLNMLYSQVGKVIQYLDFLPTEENFLGLGKRVSLRLRFDQLDLDGFRARDNITVGQQYNDQRLLGSRWRLYERLDFYVASATPCAYDKTTGDQLWCPQKKSGEIEGGLAYLLLEKPLYSLDTKWAGRIYGQIQKGESRYYKNKASNGATNLPTKGSVYLDTVPLVSPLDGQQFSGPRAYDFDNSFAQAEITRSFGRKNKNDISSGILFRDERYFLPDNLMLDEPRAAQLADKILPFSERTLEWLLRWRMRATRYITLRNIAGFALTEDYALGHEATLQTNFAANLQSRAESCIKFSLSSAYRWYMADDLLSVWLNVASRYQPNLPTSTQVDSSWVESSLDMGLNNASPRFWHGRLHTQVQTILRRNDLDNTFLYLGGDSGLRGFASGELQGNHLLRTNLEFRSEPLNVFTLHLGFAIFYDTGAVWGGPDLLNNGQTIPFSYQHSVGFGLRGCFPQFDKEPFRADFALPLSTLHDCGKTYNCPNSNWFTFAFKQMF